MSNINLTPPNFFGSPDCGSGLNFNNLDIVSYIPEKFCVGLSAKIKKADCGIVYTADSSCFDKVQNKKFQKILIHIFKELSGLGLPKNKILACYKEKQRNRLMVVYFLDDTVWECFFINNSSVKNSESICVSESWHDMIAELNAIKSASENYELWHPLINRPYKIREQHLKASILFAIHTGGLTAKQIIHLSNLTVNLNASPKNVESYLVSLKQKDLKTRANILSAEVKNLNFDETEKYTLLADWLYLILSGGYDEQQEFTLKTEAAKLLDLEANTVYAVYNNIIKEK